MCLSQDDTRIGREPEDVGVPVQFLVLVEEMVDWEMLLERLG